MSLTVKIGSSDLLELLLQRHPDRDINRIKTSHSQRNACAYRQVFKILVARLIDKERPRANSFERRRTRVKLLSSSFRCAEMSSVHCVAGSFVSVARICSMRPPETVTEIMAVHEGCRFFHELYACVFVQKGIIKTSCGYLLPVNS